jgi:hypothetical protein
VSERPRVRDDGVAVASDEESIRAIALDYYEGWFDGDAGRIERALHPELVERRLVRDDSGRETFDVGTAAGIIEAAAHGDGVRQDPGKEERSIGVRVEDVFDGIANVTVRSAVHVHYFQLAETRDGWKIVNVLWQWA